MAKEIELSCGAIALVSDDDFELVNKFSWHLQNRGYCAGRIGTGYVLLHRFILGAKHGAIVHHKNNNKLDCRRENLEVVTSSINNHARFSPKKFPYLGVNYHRPRRKYTAEIRKDGKIIRLGYFDDPFDAACMYDKHAIEHYGEHAFTNIKYLQKLLAKFLSKK